MKSPVGSSSSWAHVVWASFTWVSLQAWSEFTDLAERERTSLREMADALKGAIDALLKEAHETQGQEVFVRPGAQARQEAWLEATMGRLNEALSLVALRAGGGAKDHPTVREFLPHLVTGVTTAPISDRPRLITEAATRLAGLPVEFAEKPALLERLREAATSLQNAIAANDAARSAWSGERSDEVVAKNRLRLEMERTYGRLKALFPGRRGMVESFFRKTPRADAIGMDESPGDDTSPSDSPDSPSTSPTGPVAAPTTAPPANPQ